MMLDRRHLLIGAACVGGSAAAYALTPRRRVSLFQGASLSAISPASFGTWSSRDVTDLVAPKTRGSLADRLYNQTLERLYVDSAAGTEVMVLLAHGDTQSNELQLHRPEVCYPAFGFEIAQSQPSSVALSSGASLPIRRIVAVAPDRRENIIYWTRLGEFLPTSEGEQRLDRVQTAIRGYIADGLLARFSVISEDSAHALAGIEGFIHDFVSAIRPDQRVGFIGSRLATQMARGGG